MHRTAHEVVDDGVDSAVEVAQPVRHQSQRYYCRIVRRQTVSISVKYA